MMSEYRKNYIEWIGELSEELELEILKPTSNIQILRAEKPTIGEYYPITSWYYDHTTMLGILSPRPEDTLESAQERAFNMLLYDRFRKYYETITVQKCLAELYQMQGLL